MYCWCWLSDDRHSEYNKWLLTRSHHYPPYNSTPPLFVLGIHLYIPCWHWRFFSFSCYTKVKVSKILLRFNSRVNSMRIEKKMKNWKNIYFWMILIKYMCIENNAYPFPYYTLYQSETPISARGSILVEGWYS